MKTTILYQGDSITDCGRAAAPAAGYSNGGMGPGYAGLVMARTMRDHPARDWNFLNRGISGNRIVDLYARWRVDCINLEPDVLSILIGVNDVWHEKSSNGVEAPRFERFYRELLTWTKAERPAIRLVVLEPFLCMSNDAATEMLPEVVKRAEVAKAVAQDFGAAFVPLQRLFDEASRQAPPAHWSADGVHPTAAGHQLIADAWLAAMPL